MCPNLPNKLCVEIPLGVVGVAGLDLLQPIPERQHGQRDAGQTYQHK